MKQRLAAWMCAVLVALAGCPGNTAQPECSDGVPQSGMPARESAAGAESIVGTWARSDGSGEFEKQIYYIFENDGTYALLEVSVVTEYYCSVNAYRGKYEISGDTLRLSGRERTSYAAASADEAKGLADTMNCTPEGEKEERFAFTDAERLQIDGTEFIREE